MGLVSSLYWLFTADEHADLSFDVPFWNIVILLLIIGPEVSLIFITCVLF